MVAFGPPKVGGFLIFRLGLSTHMASSPAALGKTPGRSSVSTEPSAAVMGTYGRQNIVFARGEGLEPQPCAVEGGVGHGRTSGRNK